MRDRFREKRENRGETDRGRGGERERTEERQIEREGGREREQRDKTENE